MWFQKLRNDNDAQDEIHTVAAQMLEQVRATGKFNLSLAAFGY
jgi:thymidylate synthase ThyX